MASNPPFLVEDTDEDFFDKLVNDDDDDFKPAPLLSSREESNTVDDNDLDEAKAFANLSISDVGTGLEDLETVGIGEEDIKACSSINKDYKDESANTHVEQTRPLVNSNSFAFDSVNEEADNEATGLKEPLDSTASENHGSGGTAGVKEVQWSAFASDSVENGQNAFGSYPDFFNAFGDSPVDQIGKEDNLISSKPNNASGSTANNSLQVENINDYSQQFQVDQVYATTGEQENANDYLQQLQGDHANATMVEQGIDGQDLNSSQYWENVYPGWRYDANTRQWYQVDESYNATASAQGAYNSNSASDWTASNEKSEVSYLQQSAQSVAGAVAETGTTESITSWNSVSQSSHTNESLSQWNQASQGNTVYPSHMAFDPQYPGWYYDMNLQEWRSLDEYNSQSTVQAQDQVNQNGFGATNTYYGNDQKTFGGQGELEQSGSEAFSSQGQDYNWNGSFSNAEQQSSTMWQPNTAANSAPLSDFKGNQQVSNHYGTNFQVDNHVNQQQSYSYGTTASSFNKASQVNNEFPVSGSQSFVHRGSFSQPLEQNEMMNVSKAYGNQNQLSYSQQPVQSGHQISYASTAGRSSAGRPPHALVTFGFGGKLIVMKDSTAFVNASYGSQDSKPGSISVLNLAEAVTGGVDVPSSGASVHDYFHSLCQQSFPGPLAGGNVGGKELNRWIDERITHSGTSDVDYRQGEVLRLLLSLLKIALQHYGKLRSPFGSDTTLKENDAPELAVARLFASVKGSAEYNNYGAFAHCLQQVPSEGQIRETAAEVQTLLVSGRKKEALLRAQEGQLWGPALVLAAQLGDQFYVDTVKKMALHQLVPGSPLRTLCLLIAGQPADVFAPDATTDGSIHGAVNMSEKPAQAQLSVNGMLDDWEDNLAVVTANRTKDDELVLIHLGDCLWKERSNIIAAHICYLVAEANFEPYSDSARLCLIGADHWNHPRTYACPEAIQRTEVYEYSKLLGNSQFTLLPFQPYKLIYAHMLAEVGRVSDSLKYCQVVSKSLKTGRAPEVETWRQLVISLEDRIKTHQQGGFTNLAPGKLVGKLLNLFDSTAHRVVGGLPPPIPSTSGGSAQYDHHHQPKGPRVSTSQSTMAMSSLMPSASMEPINQAEGNNRGIMHNRSASEPDFGRSPRQEKYILMKGK
ncbi:protein transport protein SEC16B homolog isoform X2 [Cynara cardunculus var. scolymus]|uniref:protein transport protein SEC16B homolog isoform X2 n=1 Tax=Cynara cardunculus var. scolymus TaxID=59895 RepID=UPI000D62B8C2|nr:protein transport protein SEC16B homolog isoform X2 [Cynara cardunculus var. scolymus]